jgi:hypothetical protein
MRGGLEQAEAALFFRLRYLHGRANIFRAMEFFETPQGYRVLDAKGRILAYVVARDPCAMSLRASMFC